MSSLPPSHSACSRQSAATAHEPITNSSLTWSHLHVHDSAQLQACLYQAQAQSQAQSPVPGPSQPPRARSQSLSPLQILLPFTNPDYNTSPPGPYRYHPEFWPSPLTNPTSTYPQQFTSAFSDKQHQSAGENIISARKPRLQILLDSFEPDPEHEQPTQLTYRGYQPDYSYSPRYSPTSPTISLSSELQPQPAAPSPLLARPVDPENTQQPLQLHLAQSPSTTLQDLIYKPQLTIEELCLSFHPSDPNFYPSRVPPSPNLPLQALNRAYRTDPPFPETFSPSLAPVRPRNQILPAPEPVSPRRPIMARKSGNANKRKMESESTQHTKKARFANDKLGLEESISIQVPASSNLPPRPRPTRSTRESPFNEEDIQAESLSKKRNRLLRGSRTTTGSNKIRPNKKQTVVVHSREPTPVSQETQEELVVRGSFEWGRHVEEQETDLEEGEGEEQPAEKGATENADAPVTQERTSTRRITRGSRQSKPKAQEQQQEETKEQQDKEEEEQQEPEDEQPVPQANVNLDRVNDVLYSRRSTRFLTKDPQLLKKGISRMRVPRPNKPALSNRSTSLSKPSKKSAPALESTPPPEGPRDVSLDEDGAALVEGSVSAHGEEEDQGEDSEGASYISQTPSESPPTTKKKSSARLKKPIPVRQFLETTNVALSTLENIESAAETLTAEFSILLDQRKDITKKHRRLVKAADDENGDYDHHERSVMRDVIAKEIELQKIQDRVLAAQSAARQVVANAQKMLRWLDGKRAQKGAAALGIKNRAQAALREEDAEELERKVDKKLTMWMGSLQQHFTQAERQERKRKRRESDVFSQIWGSSPIREGYGNGYVDGLSGSFLEQTEDELDDFLIDDGPIRIGNDAPTQRVSIPAFGPPRKRDPPALNSRRSNSAQSPPTPPSPEWSDGELSALFNGLERNWMYADEWAKLIKEQDEEGWDGAPEQDLHKLRGRSTEEIKSKGLKICKSFVDGGEMGLYWGKLLGID